MLDVRILIDKGGVCKDIAAGEIIFNEGAHANFYYQLISGRIRWVNFLDSGKEVLHKIVESGESFGELPIFDGQPYSASAIADVPCRLIKLRSETFLELLRENPHIHMEFSKLFVQRLRFHFFLVNTLSTNSPEVILESLIDYFNQNSLYICQECNRLLLTRQQLANITGLRVETVIRTIKNLEKNQKLSVINGKVYVVEKIYSK